MSSRTIDDLREFLFFALEGLKDGKLDVERAKAMAEIGQAVINSAKVEVDAMRVANASSSKFLLTDGGFKQSQITQQETGAGTKTTEQFQGYSVTKHRMS
ncbi:hypothetical protein [Quatrionicoccus australiensis]|uniref:hypothetical protein n=1 Tax=Quatrionicoccus australiensis TaxID=138118 RepID=UPI001CF90B15|nr:hypothetical protein [Quatrionicoccus australiensis]UCV13788.1 hypothetical protein KI612_12565 [Quatrionicoccus australiensis]